MNKLFISVVFVLSLLDYGLSLVNVNCEEGNVEYCVIRKFPESSSKEEKYNFLVDYAQPKDIKNVDIDSFIEFIPHGIFTAFPNMVSFRMRTHVVQLDSDDFMNATKSTNLDLSVNHLSIIPNNVFSYKARTIATNTEDVIHPVHKLRTIGFSFNNISEIEDYSFYGLNDLTSLDLSFNFLTIIRARQFEGLPSLRTLDLMANNIATIEDGALNLPQLEELNLGANNLKRLSDNIFTNLPQLKDIDLSGNGLEHIGQWLYGLSNVKTISLRGNHIQDIDLVRFAKMRTLNQLILTSSGVKLSTINIDDDQSWDSPLKALYIDHNNLRDATELVKLRIFPKLRCLNLDDNPFNHFDIGGNQTLKDILPSLKKLCLPETYIPLSEMASIKQRLKAEHVQILEEYCNCYDKPMQ